MDSNDPKRLKVVSMDMCEDRISMLPNAILCHILSFLPTQFAVRTTVLSKRWGNAWTSVPNLDFDEWSMIRGRPGGKIAQKKRVIWFNNFVERVLTLHDRVYIKKCVLNCNEDSISSHFCRWVSAIITCKVQEFIIQASSKYDVPKQLPQSLFTCRTLTVLKIKGKFALNNPTSVCFPCVKTLQLHWVFYPDDASVERLFASCPVVEDLDIERKDWDVVLNFNISIPSLKRLSMYCYSCGGSTNRKTVVNAPNLECLKLGGDGLKDYSLCITSSLFEALVCGTSACGLLKKISNVRVLTLTGDTMMGLFFGNGKDNLPIFHNLTRMELGIEHRLGLQLLKYLLEHSPNLEELVFLQGLARSETPERRGIWRPRCVPGDLLKHLKTIEIRKYWGRQYEVRLVEHLLKHAAELERMTIYWDNFEIDMKAQEVGNRIKMLPRASTFCELNIISACCNPYGSVWINT